MKIKRHILVSLSACIMCLAGCTAFQSKIEETVSRTGIYFDTAIQIELTHAKANDLLDECFAMCISIEDTFDRNQEDSELYRLNHRTSNEMTISKELAEVIALGLEYGEKTKGAFDITIAPVLDLWDFTGANPSVPNKEDIEKALESVDYTKVHLEDTTITFDNADTMIDLGAIAKGYAADTLASYLKDQGVTSACINLGGNVLTIGTKEDGTPWRIGIQKPFSDRGEVLEVEESTGGSIVSAGTYERYFEEDGIRYFHILDGRTGYPANTTWDQVTVLSDSSMLGDVLSTCCLIMGEEASKPMLEELGYSNTWLHLADRCAMIKQ